MLENENIVVEEKQEYRNQLATVTDDGKRKWVYPKKPSGKFYNARTILSLFLLAFLVIVPFIKVNGHQFLLFLQLYSGEYFAAGHALKPFLWKWFFEKLSIGLKVMQEISVNLMLRNGIVENYLKKVLRI